MNDFLIEIGTEELPPKALAGLIEDFSAGMTSRLSDARIGFGKVHPFATPRRLALLVEGLAEQQADQTILLKGPPVKIAFDENGTAKPAATAFAKKCGVDVSELGRDATDKGEWLIYEKHESGAATSTLIAEIVTASLLGMSIPRRMRWGSSSIEFVRPVHWVLALHGESVLDISVLGVRSGSTSFGHRFMSSGEIAIASPKDYASALETKGSVVADMEERRRRIVQGVSAAAEAAGGKAVGSDALFDEVTALVEWPVAITGSFEERFLALPREVITSTLSGHQRYFSVETADGTLLPVFITVANIESTDPSKVVDGNERVVRPRLSDAEFFWNTDLKISLDQRRDTLASVVYQQGLGSIADKAARIVSIAGLLAKRLNVDPASSLRAAALCKSDLVTGMVGEFPELQGVVGRYYALANGESADVATAIEEHYLPRHAADVLPQSPAGQIVAIADRLDTLAGLFVLDKKPTGNRDPFGLRRAALAVIRIVMEGRLEVSLDELLAHAVALQPKDADVIDDLTAFVQDRVRSYVLERGFSQESFAAVAASDSPSLLDFEKRLDAVQRFHEMAEAESLTAANKRIANILKKSASVTSGVVDPTLLEDGAERVLYKDVCDAATTIAPMMAARQYAETLRELASLREPIDAFFDDVMVMVDDTAVRENRLRLLHELRSMFVGVADISRL